MTTFLRDIRAHCDLLGSLVLQEPILRRIGDTYVSALDRGHKLLFCGNGGSHAEAQHLAAEYVVRFRTERLPLAALALGSNVATLTACANDYDFTAIFAREVEALGQPGDVLTCLSTSGQSQNVILAAVAATHREMAVVAITGANGLRDYEADVTLAIPSATTAHIQVASLVLGHWLVEYVEDRLTQERTAA